MSTNIIAFDQLSNLPAHFASATNSMSLNDAAEEFSSVKFPSISIKGGRFHVKRDDNLDLVMRPKAKATDPDEPATYIEVAILNLQKCKTYYAEGYTPGSVEKPTCYSDDAVTPAAGADDRQCDTCALCPHNAWGSGTNDKGEATKGKACSDTQRVAVAMVDAMTDPMLLRVPPASLKNLAEMSKLLSKKNVPLNGVVTRISFDPTASSPVLVFKPVGFLDAGSFGTAQGMMLDDMVLAIVGKSNRGLGDAPVHITALAKPVAKAAPAVDPAEAEKSAKAEAKAKKVAAARAAAEAAAKAVADAEGDDDEDTPAPVAAPVAAPAKPAKAAKATAVASSSSFDDELAALIS